MKCFHCNEPLGASTLIANVGGREERVCCAGCLAVAELIASGGLSDYYAYRTAPGERPTTQNAGAAYASAEIAKQFVRRDGEMESCALLIDGLRCSACAWLIDQVVQRIDGVAAVNVNAATGRAHIEWVAGRATLADVIGAIGGLGYRPHPLTSAAAADAQQQERRSALKRLLVAAFGMMQVMMFAWASYSAQMNGERVDPALLEFFRLVSLLVATPVLFYAGSPILEGAWRNIVQRRIGMDVPVGAALVLAYAASVWNAFVARGDVYFDSVTMFIFFLTLGRFVTMSVRHRTASVTDALARQLPAVAHRVKDGAIEDAPIVALQRGDRILVRPGEVVPADGEIFEGAANVDESLLTGESIPVKRVAGDRVVAGALNVDQPVILTVVATGGDTLVSHIAALVERAQAMRPSAASAADRIARRFLLAVLLGAAATCALWLAVEPSRAFEATLAVLVVACPCAFAIAMPATLSAATAHLAQHGVLVTRPDALQTLAQIDTVIFDKTGTLTRGDVSVRACTTLGDLTTDECFKIAAALEEGSEHPLARAFAPYAPAAAAERVSVCVGSGVEGVVGERRYRIGAADYVAQLSHAPSPREMRGASTRVYLGDESRLLACFDLEDAVRPEARATLNMLEHLGLSRQILSGDAYAAVASIAFQCGLATHRARCSPEDKLEHVRSLQREGRRIAMVGDGVNDAPVLGAADVSIAMGRGAALSHASADIILVRDDLSALVRVLETARRALAVARQNLYWSAAYNLASLPLAAMGYVPPWLAALGMSISSILVVLNAMRLAPMRADRSPSAGSWRLQREKLPAQSPIAGALPAACNLQPQAEASRP